MMRLSRNLRRFRWLVFASWLLALVPAIYIVLTQSGHLTGGGFDVAGSQSLLVHDQLEAQYHDQGASSLALVAAPRADASYQDMNDAVAQLRRTAAEFPGVTEVPNPAQRPPQPDRPYVVTLRLDSHNTSDVAKKLREKVGIHGRSVRADRERPGAALCHRAGRAVRGRGGEHQARHRQSRRMEPADHPDRVARGVRFAGRRGHPAGARHLHGRAHHGPGLSAVDARDDVGVRHLDGVHVRHRARRRLFPVHPDAVP